MNFHCVHLEETHERHAQQLGGLWRQRIGDPDGVAEEQVVSKVGAAQKRRNAKKNTKMKKIISMKMWLSAIESGERRQ